MNTTIFILLLVLASMLTFQLMYWKEIRKINSDIKDLGFGVKELNKIYSGKFAELWGKNNTPKFNIGETVLYSPYRNGEYPFVVTVISSYCKYYGYFVYAIKKSDSEKPLLDIDEECLSPQSKPE